jgi:hypothetical protein
VNTIAATTTATGLKVTAMLDAGTYPLKVKISDKKMNALEERILARHGFHGSWNYTFNPARARRTRRRRPRPALTWTPWRTPR